MTIEELRNKSRESKERLDEKEKQDVLNKKDNILKQINSAAENGDYTAHINLSIKPGRALDYKFAAEKLLEWLPGIRLLPTTLANHIHVSWEEVPF